MDEMRLGGLQNLQRYLTIQALLGGQIDFAHATVAQQRIDLKVIDRFQHVLGLVATQ